MSFRYKPNVRCSPLDTGPPLGSCRPVLDSMSASYQKQLFGRGQGAEVLLPQSFDDRMDAPPKPRAQISVH